MINRGFECAEDIVRGGQKLASGFAFFAQEITHLVDFFGQVGV